MTDPLIWKVTWKQNRLTYRTWLYFQIGTQFEFWVCLFDIWATPLLSSSIYWLTSELQSDQQFTRPWMHFKLTICRVTRNVAMRLKAFWKLTYLTSVHVSSMTVETPESVVVSHCKVLWDRQSYFAHKVPSSKINRDIAECPATLPHAKK